MEEHQNEDLLIDDDQYPEETLAMFNEMRMKSYFFPVEFFDAEHISNSIFFKVGSIEVRKMCIIENHYYKDQIIAQYKFEFPFCAPNSKNNWEYIYDLPKLEDKVIEDLTKNGEKMVSDTFFFVLDELILHNKSEYRFISNN